MKICFFYQSTWGRKISSVRSVIVFSHSRSEQFWKQNTIDFIFLAKHLGEKNFKCEKCDMAFACNSMRYHHNQKVHEGIEFRCHICGKDFAFKKGLRRHIRNVHEVGKGLESRRFH